MRVCFVAHANRLEGADRSLIETVRVLKERGVEPHVLIPIRGPLERLLQELAVPYTVWPYYWWLGKRSDTAVVTALKVAAAGVWLAGAFPLATLLRRRRFDLVYTNTLATPLGALLAAILGVPHLWHLREFVEEDHDMTFLFGKQRSLSLVKRSSAAVVANSRAVAGAFAPYLGSGVVETVYQAVSSPEKRVSSPINASRVDPLRCLLLGRMRPGKGQEIAIEAAALLAKRGVPVRLRMVGRSPAGYRDHLEAAIREAGLGRSVSLEPFTDDPGALLYSCDVVLMCSRNEAFGRVTIEAMKAGRPVIGSRSGGTTELIDDGVTGWLYDPDDSGSLADRIAEASQDRLQLRAMGERARLWAVETFSEGRYGDAIYQQLLRAVARARG